MNANSERNIALQAELCFLLNLLVAPGLAFIVLLLIARRHWHSDNELTRCHLRQAINGSIWSGVLLALVSVLILAMGGLHSIYTWMILILYFICCHSVLILLGVWGVSQAATGKLYVYPLIGSKKW